MKLIYLLLFFFGLAEIGQAQLISRINFDEIQKTVSDSTSTYYYPQLIQRLKNQDSTLTNEAYKHLYYGNVFQEYYHPYGATAQQKLFDEAYLQNNDFDKIEQLGLAVLDENPVNLAVILDMIFLYNHTKSVEKATRMAYIYVGFLEVIYGSGTGRSCADSFVVITVDDEYRIAGDLGLTVVKQALIGSCDRLNFSRKGQHRKNRIKELYFNVKIPLTYLSNSYKNWDAPVPDTDPDEEE